MAAMKQRVKHVKGSEYFPYPLYIFTVLKCLCACKAKTAVCAWETVFPPSFSVIEAGRFNPSVCIINLVFLDSLARSKGPYGMAGHCGPWKTQLQVRGEADWRTQGL